MNKRAYDLKNEKKTWTKVTTSQISKNEAKKLYEELIQKDTDALTRKKSKILDNVNAIFTADTYLHYKELPKETEFERSIAGREKLRRQRLDEVKKREKNINNELFSH